MNDDIGIIYALTNPAINGLVKIGKTTREDVNLRIRELSGSTGVPAPFDCIKAVEVDEVTQKDKLIKELLRPQRLNPNREFYELTEAQATALLELIGMTDVTPGIVEKQDAEIEPADALGKERLSNKARKLRFDLVDIPVGSTLTFERTGQTAVTIDERTQVEYEGTAQSLSELTATLLNSKGKYAGPLSYWVYEGQTLEELKEQKYN